MRDLLLLAALVGIAPLVVRAPIIGLLAWIWITLMSPQREVHGFLSGFGLNLYVAVLTVLAWLASNERKVVPPNLVSYGLILFAAWTTLTTMTAFERSYSLPIWNLTIKSIFLALAVATLVTTKARLQGVVWMLVVAIGYYALKGGGFVLLTSGRDRVYGAADSMIGDNNALGLVLLMFLPMINYLRRTSRLPVTRFACLTTMVLAVIAVIGTYSRGALVTLAAVIATYAIRSRTGVLVALLGGVLAATLPSFLPEGWLHRMSTIESYDQDDSFMGRVVAWRMNYAIASERPLVGGGFYACNVDWVAQKFSHGELGEGKAAHSIYFEVLGDHGFVGLGLYFAIVGAAWLNTWIVLSFVGRRADLAWAGELARMLQLSQVAFLVGGSALSMAYYDGELVLLALTAALLQVVRSPAGTELKAASKWRVVVRSAPAPVSARRKAGGALSFDRNARPSRP